VLEPVRDTTDVPIADRLLDLPTETLSDALVKAYVDKHFQTYPDCQEHDAVLEDAKQDTKWYIADQEHMIKEKTLRAEEAQLGPELQQLWRGGVEEFTAHIRTLSDEEKLRVIARFKALEARILVLANKAKMLKSQRPVPPKPSHTHERGK
jgi:uncharacterized protein YdaT